jgi:hypothetical protein
VVQIEASGTTIKLATAFLGEFHFIPAKWVESVRSAAFTSFTQLSSACFLG